MPKLPGVVADIFDKLGFSGEVVRTDRLSPGLLRLTVRSGSLVGAELTPGESMSFRTSRTEFRHYTPETIEPASGAMTILVLLHGSGPGEELILSWQPDDRFSATSLVSAKTFRWPPGGSIMVMGEATALGLGVGMRDRSLQESRRLRLVFEVPVHDLDAARRVLPEAELIASGPDPGAALDGWLRTQGVLAPADVDHVFLAGHGQSIQRQRAFLRESLGFDRRSIHTQPYWATGKLGL